MKKEIHNKNDLLKYLNLEMNLFGIINSTKGKIKNNQVKTKKKKHYNNNSTDFEKEFW